MLGFINTGMINRLKNVYSYSGNTRFLLFLEIIVTFLRKTLKLKTKLYLVNQFLIY